jgi:hypothetical protein
MFSGTSKFILQDAPQVVFDTIASINSSPFKSPTDTILIPSVLLKVLVKKISDKFVYTGSFLKPIIQVKIKSIVKLTKNNTDFLLQLTISVF